MTTKKRKLSCLDDQTAAPWIARIKTAMYKTPLEALRRAFSLRIDGTHEARFHLHKRIDVFISSAAPSLSTSTQTIRELCAAEGEFITWNSRYHGIPSFGSILVTLGSIWGSAPGGQAILEWNQDRKALSEADSCIPPTLAEANVTQLIVFYACHYQLARHDSQVMIFRVLPWLIGHLYGKPGILWMLVIAVHFRLHVGVLVYELNRWLTHALYGLTEKPSLIHDVYDLQDILLLSDPRVAWERSVGHSMRDATQTLMDTLPFLPTALVPCIVEYLQCPEWLHNVETLFEKVGLPELEAQCKREVGSAEGKQQVLDWVKKYGTMLFRGTVDYSTLCEGESLWLEMSVPLKCSFGSILVDFVKARMGHLGEDDARLMERADWDERRRQLGLTYMDMDNFVPLHLASMSLTEVLCYYVRRYWGFEISCMHRLIPWLVGHLYGIRGVFWMMFVITRLQDKAKWSSTVTAMWLRNAMQSVVGKSVSQSIVLSMFRHFVYARRGASQ
jgi:hypothetical protein